MNRLDTAIIMTDIDTMHDNNALKAEGYTIRSIENWHEHNANCVLWHAPAITGADCPF